MIDKLKTQALLCAKRGVQMASATLAGVLASAGTGLLDTDWIGALSTAGMSGVLAVLVTIGGTAYAGRSSDDPAPNQD